MVQVYYYEIKTSQITIAQKKSRSKINTCLKLSCAMRANEAQVHSDSLSFRHIQLHVDTRTAFFKEVQ